MKLHFFYLSLLVMPKSRVCLKKCLSRNKCKEEFSVTLLQKASCPSLTKANYPSELQEGEFLRCPEQCQTSPLWYALVRLGRGLLRHFENLKKFPLQWWLRREELLRWRFWPSPAVEVTVSRGAHVGRSSLTEDQNSLKMKSKW